jgi:hypothetical protein
MHMPPEHKEYPARYALKSVVPATAALAALLLLAACGEPASPDVLNARVTARMAPDQPCNRQASVQYLPDGARISMPDSALFTIGRADLSACGQYAMSSAIEAMLDPGIMQVVIEPGGDIDAPYARLVRQRADTLNGVFTKASFPPYQPVVPVQTKAAGQAGIWGIVLTVVNRS